MKILTLLVCLAIPAFASASDLVGIGRVAENILEPVNMVSDFICTASIITGVSALFGAFLKYMQHRVNPLVAPISTVVVLFIIGVVLVCLPFIYMMTENGIPFSLAIQKI